MDIIYTDKVSVTERERRGRTALHYGCKRKSTALADWLLLHELDPNERDFEGRTPIFFAAMEGIVGVINRLLVIDSVDPDARDYGGKTPFYWAVHYGHNSTALALRSAGRVNTSIVIFPLYDRRAAEESD